MNVVKKDLTVEPFNDQKIVDAVNKSASRVMVELTNDDYKRIIDLVWDELIADDIDENTTCTVEELHNAVESALDEFNPKIAKSYKDYRNYKKEFVHMMDDVSPRVRQSVILVIRVMPIQTCACSYKAKVLFFNRN